MDLKQELLKKRQSLAEDTGGKRFFKRSEIEQKQIQKLRDQEKRELEAKSQRHTTSSDTSTTDPTSSSNTSKPANSIASNAASSDASTTKSLIRVPAASHRPRSRSRLPVFRSTPGHIVFRNIEGSNQSTLIGKKHQWTRDEDTKLVECLLELVACRKWIRDNGTFRPGYLKQLEQWLHQKMPGCGLKANPHIESRVKQLKKQYCAIAEMLRASEFGWNDQEKMIVVKNDLFKDWVKVHPNAAGLFKKPFFHFDDLALVFGKDRATGINAEDSADAVKVMDREMQENAFFTGDDVDIDEAPIDSVAQLLHSPGHYFSHTGIRVSRGQDSVSSAREKRKRTTGSDAVIAQLSDAIQNLGKMYESTKDSIGDLVGCFKHEKEGAERRMQVFEELKKIELLTDIERVKAGFIITKDQSAIDFFFTIDAELKMLYVQQILTTNNH